MREIGSEFHYEQSLQTKQSIDYNFDVRDSAYVFSGRTAIETVLNNLSGIKKALLPSYCCESMIVPFHNAGIEVSFYSVFYENGLQVDLKISDDVDLLLWCNYFGFKNDMPRVDDFVNRGGVVIEDITHSYLSYQPYHEQSHYVVASLRKWFPLLCGGYCASLNSALLKKPEKLPSKAFLDLKKQSMLQKSKYLQQVDDSLKELYLKGFEVTNHSFALDYSNTKMDAESCAILANTDIDAIRIRRIKNASILYEWLESQTHIRPLFDKTLMDCPLFVPIVVENEANRTELRRFLISEKIYCPIHWPKPNGCESNLYDMELSLICDQRYNEEDMKRIVMALNTKFNL